MPLNFPTFSPFDCWRWNIPCHLGLASGPKSNEDFFRAERLRVDIKVLKLFFFELKKDGSKCLNSNVTCLRLFEIGDECLFSIDDCYVNEITQFHLWTNTLGFFNQLQLKPLNLITLYKMKWDQTVNNINLWLSINNL